VVEYTESKSFQNKALRDSTNNRLIKFTFEDLYLAIVGHYQNNIMDVLIGNRADNDNITFWILSSQQLIKFNDAFEQHLMNESNDAIEQHLMNDALVIETIPTYKAVFKFWSKKLPEQQLKNTSYQKMFARRMKNSSQNIN
jgi:hypothetical protein